MKPIEFGQAFSYWIFAWFILYYFKIIPYSPKIWFILAIIENLCLLFLMFYYKNDWILIITFILINFTIKLYPLWLLRKEPIKLNDIIFGSLLFLIFLFWISINNTNLIKILTHILNGIKENKPVTPGEYYILHFLRII